MRSIVIVGGGFAGLASALGAAHELDALGIEPDEVRITVVNRDAHHAIRVRNYEPDLGDVRVPLADVLFPIGVDLVEGEVTGIDLDAREVAVAGREGSARLAYDRLILAAGSAVYRPEIPGLAAHAFSIDTYAEATRLGRHLEALATRPRSREGSTTLVVGAGLTGIEIACEMPPRLHGSDGEVRVILADRAAKIALAMGPAARRVIEEALSALGIETRPGVEVASIDAAGATLSSGERIDAATVIWTAGMRASPLARLLPVERDPLGRVTVDACLEVEGLSGVYAAGDVARARIDGEHPSVMSCQHARPMGRFAGHNAVCDLLGEEPRPLSIDRYVTCVDLGRWGALFTRGFEREVETRGPEAKRIKETINRVRIYPPRSRDRRELLAAGAAEVQEPPQGSAG